MTSASRHEAFARLGCIAQFLEKFQAKMLEFDVDAAGDFGAPWRERFYVQLKPGETTFVSWKKLLKDHRKSPCPESSSEAPLGAGAHPALEARFSPEAARERDLFLPLRFCSVLERIEKLYQGDNTNDRLNDYAENDRYDTQDSFIDDTELDNYFSVDNVKLKHNGFFVNRGKLEQESEVFSSTMVGTRRNKLKKTKKLSTRLSQVSKGSNLENSAKAAVKSPSPSANFSSSFDMKNVKKMDGHKMLSVGMKARRDASVKLIKKDLCDGYIEDVSRCKIDGKELVHVKSARKENIGCTFKVDRKEGMSKLSQVNYISKRDASTHREPSKTKEMRAEAAQKSADNNHLKRRLAIAERLPSLTDEDVNLPQTALEKAILDLKNEVAEVCPSSLVMQESEQIKRHRLPRDVKLKLTKVARLAVKQGANTDKLIGQLIKILGHVVQSDKLKKNLKAMMDFCSSALQEKEGRLQDIKEEVAEMIKSRVHQLSAEKIWTLQGNRSPSSCFEKSNKNGRFKWDDATEDRICDLCEEYIEGEDENKGFHLRKLYAELVQLWPQGCMDIMGIKLAVHRAKERKKSKCKTADAKKRYMLTVKRKLENPEDDGIPILQLITRKSPFLGQKLRRLDISKRGTKQER